MKFCPQFIHEQWVNHFVDIGDAGVMHSTFAARVGIQGAFKHWTENGWTDVTPVEWGAVIHNHIHNFLREIRNLHSHLTEQAAVHVWERFQLCVVFVTFLQLGIQCFE